MRFKWEYSLLLVFITIFLFLGSGKAFDHQITHSSPTGFMASDAFTHNWVAQNTYDTGFFDSPPNYALESQKEYQEQSENYKLFHPPILPILTASIAKISGLNVYDLNIILVFILVTLMILMNYFILSRFNETFALFSLPLSLLFLSGKFFISITWGWWDFLIGEFFLFAIILLILSEKFKFRFILSAILITSAFMSHGVETIYAAIFIIFYLLSQFLINRNETKKLIIEQVKSLILVLLIGGYSIIIFMKGMGALGYSQFRMMSNSQFISQFYGGIPANYFILFKEFTYFQIPIILGVLILVYLLVKQKEQKNNFWPYSLFVAMMGISPYLYFMAGERGFQWRFLWPIYLSFTLGAVIFLIYQLAKKVMPRFNFWKESLFFVLLIAFIILMPAVSFTGVGLVDSLDYDSYLWIHENTVPNSKFLIMYSPINSQISRLYLLKRDMFISTSGSWKSLGQNSQTIDDLNHNSYLAFFCSKEDCSLFKESHFLEKRTDLGKQWNKNLCSFDYLYLTLENLPEFHLKNIDYLNSLISKNIVKIVFNNKKIIIAKIILKGEQCEAKFKS